MGYDFHIIHESKIRNRSQIQLALSVKRTLFFVPMHGAVLRVSETLNSSVKLVISFSVVLVRHCLELYIRIGGATMHVYLVC